MFSKPNYTQTPNEFFDDIAKTLKEGELRVLLVIMRQTFGWGNKKWDRISLSQFQGKTGMTEQAVRNSLKSLIEKKMVTKHKEGPAGDQQCWYSLSIEEPCEFKDSNNSYPRSKNGGTPVLKTDTKETTTKEKEEKREEAAPPTRHFFYKRVIINQDKYNKLCDDFGTAKIQEMMDRLDEYSYCNEKRFKQYSCHGTVIRKWIREDGLKQKLQPQKSKENDKAWAYSLERKIGTNKGFSVHSESVCFSFGNWSTSIPYTFNGFKEQVEAQLRKMNLWKPEFKDLK